MTRTKVNEVGHAEIDHQHQAIVALIDGIADGRHSVEEQHELTLTLLNRIAAHFRYEEGLMGKYADPAADSHRTEHAAIGRWIDKLICDVKTKQMDHVVFQRFIAQWAKHHIGRHDKALGEFLGGRA